MKRIIVIIILGALVHAFTFAQDVTTVRANEDISENLDLEAVASVFGDSKDLEDFEYKLNDPELKISNLDLNQDGYVDYLRVVENSENQTILITIQAVIGKDLYQDVATIDVEKDRNGKLSVQVVGDVYMYGPDYIIEPVYVYSPPVVLHFWGPAYRRWHSPYYWGYYPDHYYRWHTYSYTVYNRNVHVHINANHNYYYPGSRRSSAATHIHHKTRRNDYGRAHPDRSFNSRNNGVRNTHELNIRRGVSSGVSSRQSGNSLRSANSRSSNANYSSSSNSSDRSSSGRTYTSRKTSSRSSDPNGQVSRSGNSRTYNKSGHSSSKSGHVRPGKSGSGKSVNRSNASSKSGNSRGSAGDSGSASSGSGRSKRR